LLDLLAFKMILELALGVGISSGLPASNLLVSGGLGA
jgi:hypothetical protein